MTAIYNYVSCLLKLLVIIRSGHLGDIIASKYLVILRIEVKKLLKYYLTFLIYLIINLHDARSFYIVIGFCMLCNTSSHGEQS